MIAVVLLEMAFFIMVIVAFIVVINKSNRKEREMLEKSRLYTYPTSNYKVPNNYTIPKTIKEKIPDYFYRAMLGELVSIFGIGIVQRVDDYDKYHLNSGTSGWYQAFCATCRKLKMRWLITYYDDLECYESDIFDDEIEEEIIKQLEQKNVNNVSAYYQYCCKETALEKQLKGK